MTSKDTPQKSVFIMGCGDVGRRLARAWQAKGARLMTMARSIETVRQLQDEGFAAGRCDLAVDQATLPELPEKALLYYFVPPPSVGQRDTNCARFLTLLDRQQHKPQRIVAISTTGVYGDRAGQMVTEDDAPNPQVDRARRRYDMEQQLHHWCDKQGVALILLRVGGIYGPGRLPLARIRKQVPVLEEELAPQTNRIHVDDLVSVCMAAASVNYQYRIYNVSDGEDSNMTQYFFTLADYFSLPRPPSVDWDTAQQTMSEGMLSYLRESRRVDNTRMLSELGVQLAYPDLLTGLASCKQQD